MCKLENLTCSPGRLRSLLTRIQTTAPASSCSAGDPSEPWPPPPRTPPPELPSLRWTRIPCGTSAAVGTVCKSCKDKRRKIIQRIYVLKLCLMSIMSITSFTEITYTNYIIYQKINRQRQLSRALVRISDLGVQKYKFGVNWVSNSFSSHCIMHKKYGY